jgi:hypothetical protein
MSEYLALFFEALADWAFVEYQPEHWDFYEYSDGYPE